MARRRKRRTLKPRMPKRVKRKKRGRSARGHHHPELIGLGLVALGAFLAAVLWIGWNGGYVGGWIGDGLEALIGAAALALPAALAIVGLLMVARSDLVEVRPFRTGLVVLSVGLLITLGTGNGGYLGTVLGGGLGLALGGTGVAIVGALALLAGVLLLTGASIGAILRRSTTHVLDSRAERSRRRAERVPPLRVIEGAAPDLAQRPPAPPIDGAHEFPDVVSGNEPPALLVAEPEHVDDPDQGSLLDVTAEPAPDYQLPDREVLRASPPGSGPNGDHAARIAEALVQTLANFGVEATMIGQI